MLAQNKIFLTEEVAGKGRFFRARFLQPGLVKYSFGVCLLTKEVIDSFVQGFVGCSVTVDHVEIDEDNCDDVCCGVISRVEYNEEDGWYWCEGILRDPDAIELVRNGYTVSCQYEITEYADNTENALHNGIEYDKVILGGKCEHLAIVKNPRYEGAMIAVNALDKTNDGRFVTLRRKNGSSYKAYLAHESDAIDSFGMYKAHLTAAKLDENSWLSRDDIDKHLAEIQQDVQDELNAEAKLDVTTSGIRNYMQKVAGDEDVKVECLGKYSFIIRRDYEEMSKAKAQRIRDSLNSSKMIQNARMHAKIEPVGDADTGAGWVVSVKRKEKEMAQNASDKDGKWITVKGTHVFIKDGQSVEDAMKETFGSSPTGKQAQDVNKGAAEAKSKELEGKYLREDTEFDIEQAKKDIEEARSLGYKSIDEISDFLGLDPDEFMELTGESYNDDEEASNSSKSKYDNDQQLDQSNQAAKVNAKNSIKEQVKECLYDLAAETIVEKLKDSHYLKM